MDVTYSHNLLLYTPDLHHNPMFYMCLVFSGGLYMLRDLLSSLIPGCLDRSFPGTLSPPILRRLNDYGNRYCSSVFSCFLW